MDELPGALGSPSPVARDGYGGIPRHRSRAAG